MLDPVIELANNHVEQLDHLNSGNDNYESWRSGNFDPKARKTHQNYDDHWSWKGEQVQVKPLHIEDESEIHSPPLWTTNPSTSPVHLRHNATNYEPLSPNSRTQAIVRGQRELMEMVKNMPETCYELSLKDIVEQPREENQEECLLKEQNFDGDHEDHDLQVKAHQRVCVRRQGSKNNEKKAKMMRSERTENSGLFLKMVFPVSVTSKKNHVAMNTNFSNNSSASEKVSPKPEIYNRTNSAGVDKYWWNKRFSVSNDQSDSSRSSSNSGSTGSSGSSGSRNSYNINTSTSSFRNRKNGGIIPTCLPCFHSTKSKAKVRKEKTFIERRPTLTRLR